MKGVNKVCRKATRQHVAIYSGKHDAACETPALGDWYLDTISLLTEVNFFDKSQFADIWRWTREIVIG
jgi:hypothetical protein